MPRNSNCNHTKNTFRFNTIVLPPWLYRHNAFSYTKTHRYIGIHIVEHSIVNNYIIVIAQTDLGIYNRLLYQLSWFLCPLRTWLSMKKLIQWRIYESINWIIIISDSRLSWTSCAMYYSVNHCIVSQIQNVSIQQNSCININYYSAGEYRSIETVCYGPVSQHNRNCLITYSFPPDAFKSMGLSK